MTHEEVFFVGKICEISIGLIEVNSKLRLLRMGRKQDSFINI